MEGVKKVITQDELNERMSLHGDWRRSENMGERIQLIGIDLRGLDLTCIDFYCAIIRECDFRCADLSYCSFNLVDVRGSNFEGATFYETDFVETKGVVKWFIRNTFFYRRYFNQEVYSVLGVDNKVMHSVREEWFTTEELYKSISKYGENSEYEAQLTEVVNQLTK